MYTYVILSCINYYCLRTLLKLVVSHNNRLTFNINIPPNNMQKSEKYET